MWCYKHLSHTTTEIYDNNEKYGYFRFDDDNNMGYRDVDFVARRRYPGRDK